MKKILPRLALLATDALLRIRWRLNFVRWLVLSIGSCCSHILNDSSQLWVLYTIIERIVISCIALTLLWFERVKKLSFQLFLLLRSQDSIFCSCHNLFCLNC